METSNQRSTIMHMSDYISQYLNKWVSILTDSGAVGIYQGVLLECGEDYLVIKETENELPRIITYRHLVSLKPMRVKENGKPRVFG